MRCILFIVVLIVLLFVFVILVLTEVVLLLVFVMLVLTEELAGEFGAAGVCWLDFEASGEDI